MERPLAAHGAERIPAGKAADGEGTAEGAARLQARTGDDSRQRGSGAPRRGAGDPEAGNPGSGRSVGEPGGQTAFTRRWWILYLFAATFALVLHLVLGRGAGRLPAALAGILAAAPTLLFAWLFRRGRNDEAAGPAGRRCFAVVAVACSMGAAALNPDAGIAQAYLIPELFIVLPYKPAMYTVGAVNLGLLAVHAAADPTPQAVLRRALAAAVIVVLTGLFGKPIDLLAVADERNQRLIERLEAQNRRIARLSQAEGSARERERIAREMHDTIAQGLASILALARAAADEERAGDPRASRHLAMIVSLAQEGLDDTRRMIADASPRALDGQGLAEAIGRVADGLQRNSGIAVTRSLDEALPALPQSVRVATLRIAQEAVTNVARHSRASRAEVSLGHSGGVLRLEIRDDGVGFDPEDPPARRDGAGGFGIGDMAGRAFDVGGRLLIDSAPGAGTRLCARIPLPRSDSAEGQPAERPRRIEEGCTTEEDRDDLHRHGR